MTDTKRVFSIAEFSEYYGIGRTRVYAEIRAGRLRAIKVGQRTLIIVDDAEAWLLSRPSSQDAGSKDRCHV